MRLDLLLERARTYPIFSIEECCKWFPKTTRGTMIFQLSQFAKKGKLLRVKRGLYLSPQETGISPSAIASRIDPEAIVSLESVLSRAGIIPEVPFSVVAVTSGKTRNFTVKDYGSIRFRHIKPSLNFGWSVEKDGQYNIKTAEPEKALLDLLWFHRFEADPAGYLKELRLSIPKNFSWEVFSRYAKLYESEQMNNFTKLIKQNYAD